MANVSIRRATDAERPLIERLLELYLYDMSEVHSFAIGPDGLYHYERLDEFWQHPYLVFEGDSIAGLALVIEHCPITGRNPCFFMAEFFVLRAHRRKGVATEAAVRLFTQHKGLWHVGVTDANSAAAAFWRKLLMPRNPTMRSVNHEGYSWSLYELQT